MADKHEGCRRGFTIQSETWYGGTTKEPGVVDEIMIGMYHPEGGTTGEFAVRWIELGSESSPRLEVFNDAWDALQRFGDLLAWMASVDSKRVRPREFAEALRGIGIADLTERHNPRTSLAEREFAPWNCADLKTPNVGAKLETTAAPK